MSTTTTLLLLLLHFLNSASAASTAPPNILFVLTDDQDQLLGSMDADGPCQTIRNEIGGAAGATFVNAFVNTPICCPSRAEIQTGRYMHKYDGSQFDRNVTSLM